jgi:hypothetical protein
MNILFGFTIIKCIFKIMSDYKMATPISELILLERLSFYFD